MLGRTDTRTRDRMYCQTIRTVRDIFRDDRTRIATCSLRTPTDRQTDRLKDNYSIDCVLARMLPGEAENGVGMNRSVREGKKCEAL